MATIKSFTSLEQSRKLAEILPLESADIRYKAYYDSKNNLKYEPVFTSTIIPLRAYIPCWSLAALLGVLRGTNISTPDHLNKIRYSCWNDYDITYADNPIDACVAMIEKLHELSLL